MSTRLRHSILLSMWWVANLLVLFACLRYAFPEFSSAVVTHPSTAETFGRLSRGLTPWLPDSLWLAATLCFAGLTAAFWSLASLYALWIRRLGVLDRSEAAGQAIAWAARNYFFGAMIWLSAVPLVAMKLAPSSDGPLSMAIVLGCAVAMLLLPMITLNLRYLSAERAASFADLRPPGPQFAFLFLAVATTMFFIEWIIPMVAPSVSFGRTVAEAMLFVFETLVLGAVFAIVIARTPMSEWADALQARLNRRYLVAWLLLDARWLVVAAWIAPPILVTSLVQIYVIPQYLETLRETGLAPSAAFEAASFVLGWLLEHLAVNLFPLTTLFWMASGKFLVLIERPSTEPLGVV